MKSILNCAIQLFDINYCLLQIVLAKAYKYKFGYFTYKRNYHFFNLRENSFSKSGKFEQENENICLFFNYEAEISQTNNLKSNFYRECILIKVCYSKKIISINLLIYLFCCYFWKSYLNSVGLVRGYALFEKVSILSFNFNLENKNKINCEI